MRGSNIRFLKLCLRLLIIDIVFGSLPIILYDLGMIDIFIYYGVLFVASVYCIGYSYRLLNIKCQNSNKSRKTLRKLRKSGFYQLEDCPIYSTYKSDGYGYLAKELYLKCQEKQRKLFEDKDYVIIVGSKEELKSFSKQCFINGYFSRVDKYILIFTDCETSDKKPYDIKIVTRSAFTSTFWHEWGHFVDYSNDFISETINFQRYFKNIKKLYVSSVRFTCAGIPSLYFRKNPRVNLYELVSPSEYFACQYSLYRREGILSEYLKSVFDETEEKEYVVSSEKI